MKVFLHGSLFFLLSPLAMGAASPPHFGFVPVGGVEGDDSGPSDRVKALIFRHSHADLLTVTGMNWGFDQKTPPVDGKASYDWSRLEADMALYSDIEGIVWVSYANFGMPEWLVEEGYGSEAYWRYAVDYTEAYLRKCTEYGIFHHIFENEPDGRGRSIEDWIGWYLERQSHFAAGARRAGPDHKVMGANMFSTRHYEEFYRRGFGKINDVVGFHNYSDNPHTGNDLGAVIELRGVLDRVGDSKSRIFLGEGWGPGRELSSVRRISHREPISALELRDLRNFLINGYWNLTTKTDRFDPDWILGALFFTLNDNYGGKGWKERAVPHYGPDGRLLFFMVDGYNVGLDVEPKFYNGGLTDFYGNSKDNLLDLFPGNRPSLANSGFEFEDAHRIPEGWTRKGGAFVDRSFGMRDGMSARLEAGDIEASTLEQRLPLPVIRDLGTRLMASAMVYRNSPGAKNLEFAIDIVANGVPKSYSVTPESPSGGGWSRVFVHANDLPETLDSVSIRFTLLGPGVAWMDDVFVETGEHPASSRVVGYVEDDFHNPIFGAVVTLDGTTSKTVSDATGYYEIDNVSPGVYNLTASKGGHEFMTAGRQVLSPGNTRVTSFQLIPKSMNHPSRVKALDAKTGGEVLLRWIPPESGDFDRLSIYRSRIPRELGEEILASATGGEAVDSGLEDGENYYYTFLASNKGNKLLAPESESLARQVAVRPTYGDRWVFYDVHENAGWDWARQFAQQFVALDNASLISASLIPAGGVNPLLTFQIRRGSVDGEPVGPPAEVAASDNHWAVAKWSAGEVLMNEGETYCLVVEATQPWAIYRTRENQYPKGEFFMDGIPSSATGEQEGRVNMWSTIVAAAPPEVHISDIQYLDLTGNSVRIQWKTFLPTLGVITIAREDGDLLWFHETGTPRRKHEAVIDDLVPGMRYRFDIHALYRDISEEQSLTYGFRVPE